MSFLFLLGNIYGPISLDVYFTTWDCFAFCTLRFRQLCLSCGYLLIPKAHIVSFSQVDVLMVASAGVGGRGTVQRIFNPFLIEIVRSRKMLAGKCFNVSIHK